MLHPHSSHGRLSIAVSFFTNHIYLVAYLSVLYLAISDVLCCIHYTKLMNYFLEQQQHCDGCSGKIRDSIEGTEQDYLRSARVRLKHSSSYGFTISFPGVHPVAEGQQYESCGDLSES